MSRSAATDFRKQPGRGEPRDERQNPYLGAAERSAFSRVESLRPVIATFDVDVGSNRRQETVGAFVAKNDNGIHAGEGGQDGGALAFRYERTVRTFELPAGGVGVEADDEQVAELPGALKIADVTEMEQVEASVGGDDALLTAMSRGGPASG
jgi:hypothetical protein